MTSTENLRRGTCPPGPVISLPCAYGVCQIVSISACKTLARVTKLVGVAGDLYRDDKSGNGDGSAGVYHRRMGKTKFILGVSGHRNRPITLATCKGE